MSKKITKVIVTLLLISTLFSFFSFSASADSSVSLGSILYSGQQLLPGQCLRSPNGFTQLILQSDGNLVLYQFGTAKWASNTAGKAVKNCIIQSDGNLVIYGVDGKPVWATNTFASQPRLILQDDGNLVLESYRNVWISGNRYAKYNDPNVYYSGNKYYMYPNEKLLPTPVEQSLTSGNGLYKLVMQVDGNLVIYWTPKNMPIWASNTYGRSVKQCVFQGDGNLVLYGYDNKPIWNSGSWRYEGKNPMLYLLNSGDLGIYAYSPYWATNTVISNFPSPYITANPENVWDMPTSWGGKGISNISWVAYGNVQIYVSLNGGPEALFASSGSGYYSKDANLLIDNNGRWNEYVFKMYDCSSGSKGTLIGSKAVYTQALPL